MKVLASYSYYCFIYVDTNQTITSSWDALG